VSPSGQGIPRRIMQISSVRREGEGGEDFAHARWSAGVSARRSTTISSLASSPRRPAKATSTTPPKRLSMCSLAKGWGRPPCS